MKIYQIWKNIYKNTISGVIFKGYNVKREVLSFKFFTRFSDNATIMGQIIKI